MKRYYYVGLDIHKRIIAYCVKEVDGTIVDEGKLPTTRRALQAWAEGLDGPWVAGMETTLFTGWIYDFLQCFTSEVKVGYPLMLRAIVAGKNKNDRLDARTLANLLRCDLFPECYMAPEKLRELRRVLRYRNLLVREATRMKNKTASLLMEVGAEYDKGRIHGKRYFGALLERVEHVPPSVRRLLRLSHEAMEVFQENQRWLLRERLAQPRARALTVGAMGERRGRLFQGPFHVTPIAAHGL